MQSAHALKGVALKFVVVAYREIGTDTDKINMEIGSVNIKALTSQLLSLSSYAT